MSNCIIFTVQCQNRPVFSSADTLECENFYNNIKIILINAIYFEENAGRL